MDKIFEIFKKLKMKLRYVNTKENLKVPYAIYHRLSDTKFYADNTKLLKLLNLRVEIYFGSLEKQIEFEEEFEKELEKNRFTFLKSEDITLDENVTMIYYEITGGIN